MATIEATGARVRTRMEWRTAALIAAQTGLMASLLWYWRDLGWWIVTPVGAYLVCLHGSLQHEAIHGHPTRSHLLNEVLVFLPWSLWFPYRRYRTQHLKHHDNDHLTEPGVDPESRYVDPQAWAGAPAALRLLCTANNTMLGRFVLGPATSTALFVCEEARLLLRGDRAVIEAWALHGLGIGLVWYYVSEVCGMPFWQYVLFVAYWGNALSLMRSFAEHRAHESVGCRTVVVETNPVIGLMFLNNNLHMAHHERPRLPWYDLPAYYRANRERLLNENCGYLINGYGRIAWMWGLVPKEPVAHPLPHTYDPHRGAGD